MRCLALAPLLFVACGHRSNSSVASPSEATAEPGKLPAGPPLVAPGERMLYKIALQNFELATYTFTAATELTQMSGRTVIVVEGHAKTIGLAAHVSNVDDKFTSWIDVETGHSLRFQADEAIAKTKDIEHSIADLAARQGSIVPVTIAVNDESPREEKQTVSLPEVWDFNSYILAVRAWEGPPGTTATIEAMRSRYLWRIQATIRERGTLSTELGEFPILRVDSRATRLRRDGTVDPANQPRDFTTWVSDDDGRVPLLISAKTDYGAIKMSIVDYQQGVGPRLRP